MTMNLFESRKAAGDFIGRVKQFTSADRPTTPPVSSASAKDEKLVEEVKRRWALCKACDHSSDDGMHCDLHKTCCFGKFRGAAQSACPDTPPHWGPYVATPPTPEDAETLY